MVITNLTNLLMRTTMTALLLVVSLSTAAAQTPPVGQIEEGKRAWSGKPLPKAGGGTTKRGTRCYLCHGNNAQGGYGPDLAGRQLTFQEFARAVRQPWGVMPAFPDVTDQMLADMHAYLTSLPPVAAPAPWRTPVPASDAPRAQRLIASVGCGQCHGIELADPRREIAMASPKLDYAFFAKVVYEHDTVYPENRMGLFSKNRLTESVLREIYTFVETSGFRVPVVAELDGPVSANGLLTYTLVVSNEAHKDSRLTAEEVTVSIVVPPDVTVVGATDDGHRGVQSEPGTTVSAAVWTVPKLAAQQRKSYTLTVSGTAPPPMAFKGSSVRWARPSSRRLPNAIRDQRILDSGDLITAPSLFFSLPSAASVK